MHQIQARILSKENVRHYIDLIVEQARAAKREPSAEERAIELAITDVESRMRRWEETLERGLLSLEDSAHRIRELRQEREALLKRKVELQKALRSKGNILPIPTGLMDEYIRQMQVRLREKKIGYKREFLREILKEVRIRNREVTITYKLPFACGTPSPEGKSFRKKEFFTQEHLVEPMGVEPTTSRVRLFPTFPGLPIPGRNIQRF